MILEVHCDFTVIWKDNCTILGIRVVFIFLFLLLSILCQTGRAQEWRQWELIRYCPWRAQTSNKEDVHQIYNCRLWWALQIIIKWIKELEDKSIRGSGGEWVIWTRNTLSEQMEPWGISKDCAGQGGWTKVGVKDDGKWEATELDGGQVEDSCSS